MSLRALFLAFSFAAAPPAFACSLIGDFRFPTDEQLVASADIIVSGSILELTKTGLGRYVTRIEGEKWLKGTPHGTLVAHGIDTRIHDCGTRPLPAISAGDWWTVLLEKRDDKLYISDLRTYCPPGTTEASAPPRGHCNAVLKKSVRIKHFEIAAGSRVVMGPNRNPDKLHSAIAASGSTYAGLALPPETPVVPMHGRVRFREPASFGPLTVQGNIALIALKDDKSDLNRITVSGDYDTKPAPGEVRFEGAPMYRVTFAMPGMVPIEASPLEGARFRGYVVQDYISFSAKGEITDFRSAAEQDIMGIRAAKCDNVRFHNGKPFDYPFYNVCKHARSSP